MTTDNTGLQDTLILVVSFGTSNQDTREKTIGAVEKAIADEFCAYPVRRAFTSSFIIRKLKRTEALEIDDVAGAIQRAHADGFRNLLLQPTHLMQGNEYEKVKAEVQKTEPLFDRIILGTPLLTEDADLDALVTALSDELEKSAGPDTAHLFMGHGSDAGANAVYTRLQECFTTRGHEDVFIATVEGEPTFADVMKVLKERDYHEVVLQPLMVVAGDHAVNDMAGEKDSWKTALEDAGFNVRCIMKGLGEIPKVRQLYVGHVRKGIRIISEKTV